MKNSKQKILWYKSKIKELSIKHNKIELNNEIIDIIYLKLQIYFKQAIKNKSLAYAKFYDSLAKINNKFYVIFIIKLTNLKDEYFKVIS